MFTQAEEIILEENDMINNIIDFKFKSITNTAI